VTAGVRYRVAAPRGDGAGHQLAQFGLGYHGVVVDDDPGLAGFEEAFAPGDEVLVEGAHGGAPLRPHVPAAAPEVILRVRAERGHQAVHTGPGLGLAMVDDRLQHPPMARAGRALEPLLQFPPGDAQVEVQHWVLLR